MDVFAPFNLQFDTRLHLLRDPDFDTVGIADRDRSDEFLLAGFDCHVGAAADFDPGDHFAHFQHDLGTVDKRETVDLRVDIDRQIVTVSIRQAVTLSQQPSKVLDEI